MYDSRYMPTPPIPQLNNGLQPPMSPQLHPINQQPYIFPPENSYEQLLKRVNKLEREFSRLEYRIDRLERQIEGNVIQKENPYQIL